MRINRCYILAECKVFLLAIKLIRLCIEYKVIQFLFFYYPCFCVCKVSTLALPLEMSSKRFSVIKGDIFKS